MLRVFRDRAYLVGLIGDWRSGDAVIGFDPRHVLPSDADPFDAVRATGETKESETGFGGGWIGYWGYQLGSLQVRAAPPAVGRRFRRFVPTPVLVPVRGVGGSLLVGFRLLPIVEWRLALTRLLRPCRGRG